MKLIIISMVLCAILVISLQLSPTRSFEKIHAGSTYERASEQSNKIELPISELCPKDAYNVGYLENGWYRFKWLGNVFLYHKGENTECIVKAYR